MPSKIIFDYSMPDFYGTEIRQNCLVAFTHNRTIKKGTVVSGYSFALKGYKIQPAPEPNNPKPRVVSRKPNRLMVIIPCY
jgi:hypothetical protein